jgi:hypothetical protein
MREGCFDHDNDAYDGPVVKPAFDFELRPSTLLKNAENISIPTCSTCSVWPEDLRIRAIATTTPADSTAAWRILRNSLTGFPHRYTFFIPANTTDTAFAARPLTDYADERVAIHGQEIDCSQHTHCDPELDRLSL